MLHVDETILKVLYNFFHHQEPGAEVMPLFQLYQEVWDNSSPSDVQKQQVRSKLRGMKEHDWVNYSFTGSGDAGSVTLKERGFSIVEQLQG